MTRGRTRALRIAAVAALIAPLPARAAADGLIGICVLYEALPEGRVFVSRPFEVPAPQVEGFDAQLFRQAFEAALRGQAGVAASTRLLAPGGYHFPSGYRHGCAAIPKRGDHKGDWTIDDFVRPSHLLYVNRPRPPVTPDWRPAQSLIAQSLSQPQRIAAERASQPAGFDGYVYCQAATYHTTPSAPVQVWVSEVMLRPKRADADFAAFAAEQLRQAAQLGASDSSWCEAAPTRADARQRRQSSLDQLQAPRGACLALDASDSCARDYQVVRTDWLLGDDGYRAFGALPPTQAQRHRAAGPIVVTERERQLPAADVERERAAAEAQEAKDQQVRAEAAQRAQLEAEGKARRRREAVHNAVRQRRARACAAGDSSACPPRAPGGGQGVAQ